MKFPEFIKVEKDKKLRFVDIWRIYDYQFEVLREFMMTLGDKYVMEEFTGGTGKVLTLQNTYARGQLFLYKNNVIQWKEVDYVETSSRSVTLINSREYTDVIKVVIVKSQIFRENIEAYIDEIKKLCDGSKEGLERAQRLIEAIKFLELELDQKRQEFEEQRYILVDFLADFDEKYDNFVDNVEKQESIRLEVEENANTVRELHTELSGYREEVKSNRDEVESMASQIRSDVNSIESTVSTIEELSEKAKSDLEDAILASEIASSNLEEATVLHIEIMQARDEVSTNTSIVQRVNESVEAAKEELEDNLAISETYLEEVRTIRKAIEDLGHLTPEELVDNEIVLARSGAATLGTRLDDMVYKFETTEDIQQCRHLKDGDVCLLIEKNGKVFQVLRVVTPGDGESINDYSAIYYSILDTDMYAYLLHDIMAIKGSGSGGIITDVDFTEVYEKMSIIEDKVTALENSTEVYEKMSVLEDRVLVLENSAVGISVNEDSVIIDTGNTES